MSYCYFPVAFLSQAPVPFRMSLISMAFVSDGICGMHTLSLLKMSSGANVFEISDIQKDEAEAVQ
jgi:hypothetical protein